MQVLLTFLNSTQDPTLENIVYKCFRYWRAITTAKFATMSENMTHSSVVETFAVSTAMRVEFEQ